MHALEPAEADKLRNSAGVIAIRLHPHGSEGSTHMPCLHHRNAETLIRQTLKKPLRQPTGLKADMIDSATLVPNGLCNRLRFTGAPPLLHDPSTFIDDAKMRLIQRHIESHREFHLSRCPLKGSIGDALFATLCACGHNIRKILVHLRAWHAWIVVALLATNNARARPRQIVIAA